jgi:hypothetical protein
MRLKGPDGKFRHKLPSLGAKFHDWTVIEAKPTKGKSTVVCRCICGIQRRVSWYYLRSGASKSCGCLRARTRRLKPGDTETTRVCARCGLVKSWDEFEKRGKSGRRRRCRDCIRVTRNEWRWVNPRRTLLHGAKGRAKELGLPFNLTVDDIVVPKQCPLLGIKLVFHKDRAEWDSPSIDRIVPKLGYVRGNILIISRRANAIKQDASLEEIETLAKNLRKHLTKIGLVRPKALKSSTQTALAIA